MHPQCRFENRYRNGAPDAYSLYIIETYGQAEIKRLMEMKRQVVKISVAEYQEKIEDMKRKIEEL